MLELTGMGSVLRGIGVLYWLVAIGAISLALVKGKTPRAKALWTAIAFVVFGYLPGKAMIEQYQRDAYAKEAWAYFKKKCDTDAGEKIYKTYRGVKSVLVVRPLPPATEKDLYDQFWYGDPYSSATPVSDRGLSAAKRVVSDWKRRSGTGTQRGLDFIEVKDESSNGYIKISRPLSNDRSSAKQWSERAVSRFGIAWDDISKPEDRKYWVAGSRLSVIDLSDNSIVAERIGFMIEAGFGSTVGQRRPWLTSRGFGPNGRSCPDAHDATDQWFITSVFKQE